MESALLKKLSSNHPQCNYSRKFDKFMNRHPTRMNTIYNTSSPILTPFQKYHSTKIEQKSICKTSRSSRPRKNSNFSSRINPQKVEQNICGWSVDNQENFNSLFEPNHKNRKPLPIQRAPLTQAKHQNGIISATKNSQYQVRKVRTKLESVIIEPIFTEPVHQYAAFLLTPRDKQNISSEIIRKASVPLTSTSRKPLQGLRFKRFRSRFQN